MALRQGNKLQRADRGVRSLAGWRMEHMRDDRIGQRELEIGKRMTKAGYRAILNMLMEDAAGRIESGEIRIESMEDVEILLRLGSLLMGKPAVLTEGNRASVIELPESTRDLLDAKIEELRKKK